MLEFSGTKDHSEFLKEFPIDEGGIADSRVCAPTAAAAMVRPFVPELASERRSHRSATPARRHEVGGRRGRGRVEIR